MSTPPEQSKVTRRNVLEYWWLAPIVGVAGFFGWLGIRSWNILIGKPAPSNTPKFVKGEPLAVARGEDFAELWDAKEFRFGAVPAIVVRVKDPQPGGISVGQYHFIAFSKICTHLRCTCQYIRNPEIASMAYKYRPEFAHPVLGCACHFSAFDPELAGKSVSGPALEPLPRVQLEIRKGQIFAVGLETA
jgi:arsenite oxidase small subunit